MIELNLLEKNMIQEKKQFISDSICLTSKMIMLPDILLHQIIFHEN